MLSQTSPLKVGALVNNTGSGSLEDLFQTHRRELRQLLLNHGSLLFRGFSVDSVSRFQTLTRVLAQGESLSYHHASTPRTRLIDEVYTSTEYPEDKHIHLHNENSYTQKVPSALAFCCIQAAVERGQTPIADSALMYNALPSTLRREFEAKGVLYIRNFGCMGLRWQEVFKTDDRQTLSAYFQVEGIDYEWLADGGLRTWERLPAVRVHPVTGEKVWFNQANLFHVHALDPLTKESLLDSFAIEDLPRHVTFGDGSPIADSMINEIQDTYNRIAMDIDWQEGDMALLDNYRVAHGRRPFRGPRRILVSLLPDI